MIDTRYFRTRKDGVRLYRTVDALTDDKEEVIVDKNGLAVLRGFYILQNETNIPYDVAIDIEGTLHTYSETDKPIPEEKLAKYDSSEEV